MLRSLFVILAVASLSLGAVANGVSQGYEPDSYVLDNATVVHDTFNQDYMSVQKFNPALDTGEETTELYLGREPSGEAGAFSLPFEGTGILREEYVTACTYKGHTL